MSKRTRAQSGSSADAGPPRGPQQFALKVYRYARGRFRNTWVHRLPITGWLYRKVFRAAFGEGDVDITFRGLLLVAPAKDITIVPSLLSGDYEAFELDLLGRIVKPGNTVLDVGGNLGVYAVIASKLVGPDGRVFTFEPVSDNIAYLSRNLEANGCTNVTLVHAAVGASTDPVRIHLSDDNIGTHSAGLASERFEEVPGVALDDFVQRENLTVDVVKVDVEGFEYFVLEGAQQTLATQPTLLIEYVPKLIEACGGKPVNVLDQLFATYAHVYVIDERSHRLLPVERSDRRLAEGAEIEFGVNLAAAAHPLDG